ncbi:MAG: hypothetical protein AABN33_15050 [Acidobacteriota bacterium]
MDSEKKLRNHIRRAIEVAQLDLDRNDVLRLEDQIVELLGAYKRAPAQKREHVYRRGEQRILQAFRPPAKDKLKAVEHGAG